MVNRNVSTQILLRKALALGLMMGGSMIPCFAAEQVDFSREILPILSENCFYCHGPDADHRKAKLRLDDEADAKRDRKGEFVIFPGDSTKSSLISRILTKDEDDLMPPPESHKKLTQEQIASLKRWIDAGANWGEHWAFTPIKRPSIPKAKTPFVGSNPVDAFVFARLATEKLTPSPQADKTTLIRRVTLDLTGVPPTLEEVDAFLDDPSKDAYEKVVDRLLASTAYGERMAWDWMEVARYADSNGYQGDAERTMWPWRDWVIKAFNSNMPYDKFTILQLAGDLVPNASEEDKLATAFCRNHPINGEGGRIAEESRVDYVMDMTETTGTAWLGLTFNCTRCHDHKFDPLTRRDYYSMFAFFNQTPVTGAGGNPQTAPIVVMADSAEKLKLSELEKRFRAAATRMDKAEETIAESPTVQEAPDEIKKLLARSASKLNSPNLEKLNKTFGATLPDYAKQIGEAQKALKEREDFSGTVPKVMVMEEMKGPRKTFVLDKGVYSKPVEEVSATTPAKLPSMPEGAPRNRLGLAQWLVSAENPLTPRVTVNRMWQMFFGVGLVKTSEDFGTKGESPVHPDLLDWLASEFRDSGWDTKKLIRVIVTSNTYRQSSKVTADSLARDPENRLLSRGPRYRMPSWMLRDQALAASGLLVKKVGGAPVKPYQPNGVWEEATFGNKKYQRDGGDDLYRRSLYTFWRRIIGPTAFFDTPSRMTCNVKPTRNNTPLHALTTLNDITYVEAARNLAERVIIASSQDHERAVKAFQFVLARKPTNDELRVLLASRAEAKEQFSSMPNEVKQFLAVGESKRDQKIDAIEHAAWTTTCLAILNLDEALTKE